MNQLEQLIDNLVNAGDEKAALQPHKINITVKIDDFGLFRAEYLAKKFGMSRTGFCQEILSCGLYDAFRLLGYSDDEEFNLYVETRKAEREGK